MKCETPVLEVVMCEFANLLTLSRVIGFCCSRADKFSVTDQTSYSLSCTF